MFSWKIGGEAGYGIMVTGLIFSKACTRGGLYTFDYVEYPSLIRGGHNVYQVRVEKENINSPITKINLLVALNNETIERHKNELVSNGGIIYDQDNLKLDNLGRNDLKLYHVPLMKIAKEHGNAIMRNTVALGASFALLDYDWRIVENTIRDAYKGKGEDIVQSNIKTTKAGWDYIKNNYKTQEFEWKLEKISDEKKMVLTGNEAIAFGAIKAGCKYAAIYPMTPISNIQVVLANNEYEHNILLKEPEDEIAGIHMALGASHAGARSMVATSGGGFCLMSEGYGLAGITETPLVIIEGMRGGPSTGIPTWTDQGDLKFVLNASHGDFPRIVLAPGDIEQSFYYTIQAFEIAEKYQSPVIVLVDKQICESKMSLPFFKNDHKNQRFNMVSQEELNKGNYLRFKNTPSGVSPRSVPGMPNGLFIATSDEHGEYGLFNEEIDNRNMIMQKRYRKLETLKKELPEPIIEGDKDADLTIISWGSNRGSILDAMKWLKKEGLKVNFVQPVFMSPFPAESMKKLLKKAKKTLLIEGNYAAHLGDVIKEQTLIDIKEKLLKYDGRPIYPEEVYDKVKSMI